MVKETNKDELLKRVKSIFLLHLLDGVLIEMVGEKMAQQLLESAGEGNVVTLVNNSFSDVDDVLVITTSSQVDDWMFDLGYSSHVSFHGQWFTTHQCMKNGKVLMKNGLICEVV